VPIEGPGTWVRVAMAKHGTMQYQVMPETDEQRRPGTRGPLPGDHRERLLAGMATAVRAQGFQATTLADVVREARASRRTFYAYFADPTDCYLALLQDFAQRSLLAIAEAIAGAGSSAARVDRAVGSFLDALQRDPLLTRSFFRELHLTGERGRRLDRQVNERAGQTIHELVEDARAGDPALQPVSVDTARMIVAGIVQMALAAHDQGDGLDGVRATATGLLRRVLAAPEPAQA
jgi:AcrR family transcriptional regulator